MKDLNYNIIEDISYSKDDIAELGLKESNVDYGNRIPYIFMIGATILSSADINAESQQKTDVNSSIEFVVSDDLALEDYQNNILSLENYPFCFKRDEDRTEWIEKILSFKSLQESWDGFGAIPLEIKSSTNAIKLIESVSSNYSLENLTDIFPNPHGTVSMIWENNYNEKLSLEVGNTSISYYTVLNGNSPEFFNNIEITDDTFEKIITKIKALF